MGDANDLTGKVGLDTTDFKTAISSMNRDIRVIESGFRATAAGLGDWANSASGVEARIKALNSEIEIQTKKVAAVRDEYERVAAAKGADSKAAQDLQIRLNKENEMLGKMQSELGQSKTKLVELGAASGSAGGKLDTLKSKISGVVSGLGNLVTGLAKAAAKLAVGLATGVAGAVVGLTALVTKTAATADELVELSDKTGIPVERLQELSYIGKQTGTDMETVTGSMAKLVRSMSGAADGTGDAAKAFKTLGISIVDSNGNLRNSQDVFNEALAALGGVGNETERDALAMAIFGKSAQELNPLIKTGSAGLAAMAAEAHKVGAVMSEEATIALANLNDRIEALKAGFMGLVAQIATAVLPVFDQIVQAIMAWLQSPAIQAGLKQLKAWLAVQIPAAIQTLSSFWTGTLLPAILAVWSWMQSTLIPFLQGSVLPVLQTVIPAALQFLANAWSNVLWPAIQAIWKFLTVDMMPIWTALGELIGVIVVKDIEILTGIWQNILKPALTEIWSWISTKIIPIFKSWLEGMKPVGDTILKIAGFIQKMIDNLKNLKLRVSASLGFVRALENMGKGTGMTLQTIPWADLYNALQTGVVDGCWSLWGSLVEERHYEVLKYYTALDWSWDSCNIAMNRKAWEKLPQDLKDAMFKAGREAEARDYRERIKTDEEYKKKVAQGGLNLYFPTAAERDVFRKKANMGAVWDELAKPWLDKAFPGQNMTKTVQDELEKVRLAVQKKK